MYKLLLIIKKYIKNRSKKKQGKLKLKVQKLLLIKKNTSFNLKRNFYNFKLK